MAGIKNLGSLCVIEHQDLQRLTTAALKQLRDTHTIGSYSWREWNEARMQAIKRPPLFRTVVGLYFSISGNHYSNLTDGAKIQRSSHVYLVSSEGEWTTVELITTVEGKGMGEQDKAEHMDLILSLAHEDIGRLLTEVAKSLSGSVPHYPNAYFMSVEIAGGLNARTPSELPHIKISFDHKGISNPYRLIDALERKMNKWWREIVAAT